MSIGKPAALIRQRTYCRTAHKKTLGSLIQNNVRPVSKVFYINSWSQPMKPTSIDPDMTVDEIMRRWPSTIAVAIRHGMLCVGCPIGIFHTVTDACAAHGLDEDAFSAELLDAMRRDPQAHTPSAFARGRALTDELGTGV